MAEVSFRRPSVRVIDAFLPILEHPHLSRFVTFSSSVSGFDKTLRLIIYTLKCVSLFLPNDATAQKRIAAIIAPMFESRYLLRMYGLIAMVTPLLHPMYPLQTKDPALYKKAVLERIMTYSMWVYYPAEYIYYLVSHRIIGPVKARKGETLSTGDGWSRLSCAAWAVYIVADLYGSIEALLPRWQELKTLEKKRKRRLRAIFDVKPLSSSTAAIVTKEAGDKDEEEDVTSPHVHFSEPQSADEEEEEDATRYKVLTHEVSEMTAGVLSNLADLPLAINWSTYSMPLSNTTVSLLGLVGSVINFGIKWRHTKA